LYLQGFSAIFQAVNPPLETPVFAALLDALKRRCLPAVLGLTALALTACKENLSSPPTGGGPDTTGPAVRLAPGTDTTVDSVGVLLVSVLASAPSGIKTVDFTLLPGTFAFPTQSPLDTVFGAFYSVPLGTFKHSTFKYFVQATDILDHETVTDTVTVTVK